jgi:nucleotide-binding universal stress UspA family protein
LAVDHSESAKSVDESLWLELRRERDAWRERVLEAMQTLDLVVFVPIESPDRIAVPAHEDSEQRIAVHERLEALLVDDELGAEVEVLRVEGNPGQRVNQIMARVDRAPASGSRSGSPIARRRRPR